jgi:hypothetical protein
MKVLENTGGGAGQLSGFEKPLSKSAQNFPDAGDVSGSSSSIPTSEDVMARKQIRRRATLLGLAIGTALALLATGVARAQELTEEFHQQYPLAQNGSVTLKNLNGWVHISGWDQNQVKIDAVKRARTKQRLDEAKITVHNDANSIDIRTRYPENNDRGCDGYGYGYGYGAGSGGSVAEVSYSVSAPVKAFVPGVFTGGDDDCHDPLATVDYTVTVPRNARLEQVSPVNGSVEISGVKGPVHVSAVNGRVTVKDLMGDSDVSSVNGTVEASFDQLGGSSRVHAVNGRVMVTVPSNANVRLRAHSLNGSISNDFGLPESRGWPVGHDLDGKLGEGASALEVNTVNGRVEIRHANDGKPMSTATSMLPKQRTLAPY